MNCRASFMLRCMSQEVAHRVIALRYGIWSLSGHSGRSQAVHRAGCLIEKPRHLRFREDGPPGTHAKELI
jgi:hypothetical protein